MPLALGSHDSHMKESKNSTQQEQHHKQPRLCLVQWRSYLKFILTTAARLILQLLAVEPHVASGKVNLDPQRLGINLRAVEPGSSHEQGARGV